MVGCWAHARRKFDEAMKSLPKGKAKGNSAAQGLAYCTLLFEIEKGLTELTPAEQYDQRLRQAMAHFSWGEKIVHRHANKRKKAHWIMRRFSTRTDMAIT